MPNPALAGALVQGGAQVAGAGLDALFTGIQNRASRRWSERMYDRQFNDNVAFWNMQNEYNSPQQQMQRLKLAGLNPNYAFGQGAVGNAGSVSTPDVQAPQFRTPDIGSYVGRVGSVIGTYLDYEIKQAQLDNLKTDNTVKQEDALLRKAQTRSTLTAAERAQFDLDFERGLSGVSADFRREGLRQRRAEIDRTLTENELRQVQTSSNIREAAQRIANMRSQRISTEQDIKLKQLDIELKRLGIQPTDHLAARVLARILNLNMKN